jgi:2-polyprenyl-3-methyl-5-hydroxy-6-metoxy-1,4-benzoquinol methylase
MTRDAFVQRLNDAVLGAFDIASTYLGLKLGLYSALATYGPMTPALLARQTGTDERLVREWLEHQGASGLLEATQEEDGEWRFALAADHTDVLLDPDALDGVAGTMYGVVADLAQVPRLAESFRTGEGIPYADYGPDQAIGQAMGTRPVFRHEIKDWFDAVPDLAERLHDGARVLEIGCGGGWSSVCLAHAFPGVTVDGVDLDPGSVEAAQRLAEAEEVTDRVTFELRDAADLSGAGYDVATMFEMVHDLARPVDALRAAREAVEPDGVVLVADEPVADAYAGNASDAVDRLFYGYSLLHCLPASMTEPGSAATGTVMRPDTLRRYAEEAGFASVEVLPVESVAFRLYLLRP